MAINLDIGITGNILGMPAEALIFGFIGSLVYVVFGGVMSREKSLSTVFIGMILGGVFSPLIHTLAIDELEIISKNKTELFDGIIPFLIGFFWRFALPLIVDIFEKWATTKFGENKK